jgi:hypothetical protein
MKPSIKIQWQDFKFKLAQFLGIAPTCDEDGDEITSPWVEREQAAVERLGFTHGVRAARGQDWDYIAWFRDNELAHGQFGSYIIGFRTGVRRAATAGPVCEY